MADFVDVGGVKVRTAEESWNEERMEIGDIAEDDTDLAMSGRPIESRSAIVRQWQGTVLRDAMQKDGVSQANAPAGWERLIRWVEGWGQCFSGKSPVSGAGISLTPAANYTVGASDILVSSGVTATLITLYSMRVRGGFLETGKNGWSFGFKRTFVAGEDYAPGTIKWLVATGAVAFAQGTGDVAGVTQYVDGVATTFRVGNFIANQNGNFSLYGKKQDGTNNAINYRDIFFVPFQLPATWVSQIFTNMINPGIGFPVLPFQRLSGQWLTNEDSTVQVIGRVKGIQQRVGQPAGQNWQPDLRELALTFTEA